MPPNPLGSNVSRYISPADRQLAGVVFERTRPPLDSELNLLSLLELEQRAEEIRAQIPSGWLMNESNPRSDFHTSPLYSNQFFFGKNAPDETRGSAWAVVNGWPVPVSGTRTGAPPLAPNNVDTWNRVALNPPSTSTGGNRAEFVFLEVWLARVDVDPSGSGVAPGKPQRGFLYRFGNVESGFSHLPDDLVDPDVGYETSKRIQVQHRLRVVADVNLAQNPEGFDPTLVFAQGALSAPGSLPFSNMRQALGDPGLWRAGSGDPELLGTVDGYVYAIPVCVVFRRNGAGFSDIGNLAGAFNRNSKATTRDGATSFSSLSIQLPGALSETDVQFTMTSVAGTQLAAMSSFGEAYFRLNDEILRVVNVVQTGPTSFVVTVDRGQLGTVVRAHPLVGSAGPTMRPYTVRPDGLYADQVTLSDILDLRHSVADKFDYDSVLKTNLVELMKGNLRTTWKRYGSTNSAGSVVLYGDRITDGSSFVGGLSRLDGPNGNRRMFSDAVTVERYEVAVRVPSNSDSVGAALQVQVVPYTVTATWDAAASSHPAGSRLNGGVQWWWNGDRIKVALSDFLAGMPSTDADQVRFVLPSEDPDAVIARFEGMTTDPNGGLPEASTVTDRTTPTASNPNLTITGLRVLKHDQGLSVSVDASGNLLVELESGTVNTALTEFTDAVPTPASSVLATNTVLHLQFAVIRGAGRGLSHKPDYVHQVHFRGDPTNASKVMLRPGLADKNRMVPTALSESPYVQTGRNRQLARTSEVMVDPGSKSVWIAPYRSMLLPPLLVRDGSRLNWYGDNGTGGPTTYQGPMPTLNQAGSATAHAAVDPLTLFYTGALGRYVEVPFDYLPRPGLHHVPVVPTTNAIFPSGINFLLMSKEGPFGASDTSDWNRNLVSYPSTPGYYVVTPVVGESYGAASGSFSAFGRKYSNPKLRAAAGGAFRGIQFPPFYAPARITGVYKRDTTGSGPYAVVPASSPFSTDRVYVGGAGTDANLLRDDFDGPTFLLDVDANGDLTFVLNADVLDLSKAGTGVTFDNSEFLIECTLFGFDRGFLQTNGRILGARSSSGGSIPVAANAFTSTSDQKVGLIAPAPMTLNATNNEVTVYYSRQPYQGDAFGSQSAFSDDPHRIGPLTVGEANSLKAAALGPVSTLSLPNKAGYEVLSAINFVTTLGTGRLSGANPLPILSSQSNPDLPQDVPGSLTDLSRRFSLNRVGYEDWKATKFPILDDSLAERPELAMGGLSEVFDRDIHPELAGCVSHLPLGAWFREKDFLGKTLYQSRSSSNVGIISLGTLAHPPYIAPQNPAPAGAQTWEGVEFVCGNVSNTTGVGGEVLVKVDGTSNVGDNTRFKTTRGGAAWSATAPWPGGAIASRMSRAKPNSESGSVLAGTAYLVRSHPEVLSSVEVHPGHELQMIIVTHASPAYVRDTEVLHSANGTNEGFTAVDRFRLWGKPLEKRRGRIELTTTAPGDKPLFANAIYDDPTLFGSSDISTTSYKQEILAISADGVTELELTERPLDQTSVMAWLNGVKLALGVNYTIGGLTNQTVTYVPTGSNPALLAADVFEVWYPLL